MVENKMIFTAGLPGAGKSTAIRTRGIDQDATVIDPDAVKAARPDYDPKNPQALHYWSKAITDKMLADAIAGGTGKWIVDGTGTNADSMVHTINRAKAAGFETEVVYVRVTLETSLKRNAARERNVPEAVIFEKAELITTSMEIVSHYADAMTIIDND